MPTANELLENRAIRHAVFMQRHATFEVREVIKFLNKEVLPDLEKKIASRVSLVKSRGFDRGVHTSKRLQNLMREVRTLTRAGARAAYKQLRGQLRELALSEARFQKGLLEEATTGLGFTFETPDVRTLNSIVTSRPMEGSQLKDWFDGIGRNTGAQIERSINVGMAQGETTDEIVRRLVGTRANGFRDGVWATTRRNAEAVTRTATNHVANHARMQTYEENSEVVKGWRFVATLDARTTLICASNDGRVWKVGEGEQPPLHFSCRSTTTPVLKSWKELGINLKGAPPGTRASMNGQVPQSQTFGRWLKKQPAAFQKDYLGPGRYEVFKRGKLKIERFTDAMNRPLSVDELVSLEKKIAA